MNGVTRSLVKGSLILLITFNLYNLLNFLFQFSMVRMLTVSEYGTLAALFSIIYLLGIFTEAIQTVMTKYSSKESDKGKLKNLMNKALKKSFRVSLMLFVFYLFISIFFSYSLKISYPLLMINGLMIFFSFLLPVNRGIMLGRKKYKSLGINMILESTVKLLLAVLLVFIGWKLYGAIISLVIGSLAAFVLSFSSFKDVLSSEEKRAETTNIYSYTTPVLILTTVIIAFYSIDVFIAKMVFSDEMAGYYAIASILAKTILWGTIPISKAMFPISAESHKTKSSPEVLFKALLILILTIIVALAIFYFFPSIIIRIFSGRYISESSQILFYVSLGTSILSISYLVIFYKLSLGRTKGFWLFSGFLIMEMILLTLFSSTLLAFSMAFALSSFIFLLGSILLLNKNSNPD